MPERRLTSGRFLQTCDRTRFDPRADVAWHRRNRPWQWKQVAEKPDEDWLPSQPPTA